MGEWYKLTYYDGETDVIRIKEGYDRHEREGDTWEPAVVFTVEELDAREKNWSDSVAVLTKMCLEYIERIAELEAVRDDLFNQTERDSQIKLDMGLQLAERSEWIDMPSANYWIYTNREGKVVYQKRSEIPLPNEGYLIVCGKLGSDSLTVNLPDGWELRRRVPTERTPQQGERPATIGEPVVRPTFSIDYDEWQEGDTP